MIEVADSNAIYYYHFDALGSVVALSDASGDTVQTYEYSVYGEVAVEDANHTNPFMFAGVRYDIEIGLYYNRARYYNPYTGRFLQTDPIGYGDGMNLYAYCRNNPITSVDPSGLRTYETNIPGDCIPQYDNSGTAVALVSSWLADVGFFDKDEYYDWTVQSVDIIEGGIFHITLYIEDSKWRYKDPNFGVSEFAGIPIVTIDSIGRLDSGDRLLNRLIHASFSEMNERWSPSITADSWEDFMMDPARFPDLVTSLFGNRQTPFGVAGGPREWKYKHKKYDPTEINYILMGHGMKHKNIGYNFALKLVDLWKGHYGHDEIPQDVIYWFTKGYGEYEKRAGW